jgi:hypothetical protein
VGKRIQAMARSIQWDVSTDLIEVLDGDSLFEVTDKTPYIASIDVEDEILTIVNPSSEAYDLSQFIIKDDKGMYKLQIPEGTVLDGNAVLFVYTCPGLTRGIFEKPNVLWRNADGCLRRKPILNNGNRSCLWNRVLPRQ